MGTPSCRTHGLGLGAHGRGADRCGVNPLPQGVQTQPTCHSCATICLPPGAALVTCFQPSSCSVLKAGHVGIGLFCGLMATPSLMKGQARWLWA